MERDSALGFQSAQLGHCGVWEPRCWFAHQKQAPRCLRKPFPYFRWHRASVLQPLRSLHGSDLQEHDDARVHHLERGNTSAPWDCGVPLGSLSGGLASPVGPQRTGKFQRRDRLLSKSREVLSALATGHVVQGLTDRTAERTFTLHTADPGLIPNTKYSQSPKPCEE